MSDIFLSYNREDQSIARRFADGFEAAGLSVWWDVTLRPGEVYDEVTEAALLQADVVVVLWSKRSVASRWVRSEAAVGHRTGRLAPVMIEACERPVMFELIQTSDLSGWQGEADHPGWRGLLNDIRRRQRRVGDVPTPVQLASGADLKLPSKPSIALLPFANLGPEDDDHLADGVLEEISTVLSRFASLFVIAGQSSLSYRGSTKPAPQIARELGVRYLLEGSVRRAGGRVRIAVKLVDALVGEQVWAERFDEPGTDLFDLQDRVALAVAATMDASLGEAEMRRAVTRPTASPNAYELTVRANALLGRYNKQAVTEALDLAQQATRLDPDYAWAIAIAGF
ncbi:MAG TPA: TIR domain-containing protein, partial [Phenylobacterium sp.]